MKWKITGRYILSIVLVVMVVVCMNIFIMFTLLIAQSIFQVPIFQGKESTPEQFTRQFENEINIINSKVSLSEMGERALMEKNAWIQILDENGKVIDSYRTPTELKEKYTPAEIVQTYKYQEIAGTTVFVGEKQVETTLYSYLIGIEDSDLKRLFISINRDDILQVIKVTAIILIIDILIALFIGYLFSKRLTKPLHSLIDGIKRLANKDYQVQYKAKGIYKDVFVNVNYLSDQLTVNEKERKKLEKMREEWISNISHDLKTPLASIQGYAELIKDPDYEFTLDEMKEYAEIIEQKSIYIKEVIEDLNISTRLRNNSLSLHMELVNIVALLRNSVIDILNDPKYSSRHITFYTNTEQIFMEVDAILLRRAINNLIYNAIVHNDEHVKIDVKIVKEENTQITIKDSGKGIKKEELERVFDRYYRGTNTGDAHKGSGLGMAIAKEIIQEHKGEISIKSKAGIGTTIEILFYSLG